MPITNLKTVNFGKGKSGLTGDVGYTLYSADGTVSQLRTTSGIYEFGTSGIYASEITFSDTFHGTIFWDVTGSGNTVYASEEYNATTSATVALESVAEDIAFIKDIEGGMWKIDRAAKQMIFYKSDNDTEVARFNLFDQNGAPSVDLIYKRLRV
jgi:hypothetical protein